MDATEGGPPDAPVDDADAVWEPLEAAGDPLAGAVEEAVEDARSGAPVAVVGAPFGGREQVLERVAARLDARHVTLGAGDAPPALDGPTVVAGAHHCHTREVGGFTRLERLFEGVATADVPVVTGWNEYAWRYCRQARDAGRRFDAVGVPALGRESVAALVREWAAGVTFEAPPPDTPGLLSVDRQPLTLPVLGRVSVPVPRPNPDALATRGTEEDPETAVVRRLADLSAGNPGVARALWTTCVADAVAPTDLRTPVTTARESAAERNRDTERRRTGDSGPGTPSGTDSGQAALDRYDAFCLRVVLAGASVPRAAVAAALGPVGREADAVLARLERHGYLTTEGDRVTLRPAAVPDAVAVTERRDVP